MVTFILILKAGILNWNITAQYTSKCVNPNKQKGRRRKKE